MPSGFQQSATQRFTAPPWTLNPNITDLIWPSWQYTETDNGQNIVTLNPAKGSNVWIPGDLVSDNNLGSVGAYNGQCQLGGNSSYVRCDAVASYVSGTGRAWSSYFAGNLPRLTNSGLWYLLSYTRLGHVGPSSPLLQLQGSGTLNQNMQLVSRNDAGVVGPASSVFSPGRNLFTLGFICDGTHLTSLFNGDVVDSAIPWNPGTTTLDTFGIGLSLTTGGFSRPNVCVYATSPLAWSIQDDFKPMDDWTRRYMRI